MLSRLILFVFILLFVQTAHADTFIVTSNADSGPGTLREAITLANANGTAVTDYIHFNIADVSEAGRTIALVSDLPTLTSKIVIDGTTQPGSFIGVSNAKVIITTANNGNNTTALKILYCTNIEIFGMYIKDMHNDMGWKVYGISLFNCKKVTIGAPDKGNYFTGNVESINSYRNSETFYSGFSDSVVIQSNIFGLTEDGEDIISEIYYSIRLYNAKNVLLGGDNPNEGNFISGPLIQQVGFLSDSSLEKNTIIIKKNKFGVSQQTNSPLKFGGLHIQNLNNSYTSNLAEITIKENLFENAAKSFSNSLVPTITIIGITGFIDIKSNKINTLTQSYSGFQGGGATTTGIHIAGCKDGIIGGNSPLDTNYIIGGFTSGISLIENENIIVTNNSIFCNTQGIKAVSTKVVIPEIKIMYENGTDLVSGTATPNSKIEVYQTPFCQGCDNGKIYMGETTSDANGNWNFNGAYSSAVTATATSNNRTGEFASPKFEQTNDIFHPTCGLANGYIKGTKFISGTRYYWLVNTYTGTEDTIFNQLDIENLKPGLYEFVVEQTKYCKKSYRVVLSDVKISISTSFINIRQPSCGKFNGNIAGINAYGPYNKVFWLNQNRDTVSFTRDLIGVGEGTYKFFAIHTQYGCADSTQWFTLTNQSGPTLNINNIQITSATCENADGSIKNVSALNTTGTQYFAWVDSLNRIVSSTADLLNAPAGKYKLKFKDDGGCDTIITPYYIIPSTGRITIDSSQLKIQPAGCTVNNGAINGLNFTNATQFSWQGLPAVNTASAIGLPAGSYTVTASNNIGCSAQATFTVPTATLQLIMPDTYDLVHSTCDNNNGSINIKTFKQNNPAYYTFQWHKRETGNLTGTGVSLSNLSPGNYDLTIIDTNGCSKKVFSIEILNYIAPLISTADVKIYPDQCSTNKGSIMGIKVGISRGPENSYWIDENNNIISHSKDLINIGAGKYQLITKDNDCMSTSQWFTVTNNNIGTTPQYDDQIISRYAPAILKVKNPVTGTYFLYSNPAATQLVSQSTNGVFSIPTVSNDIIYYIKHINSSCTSPVVPVKITVVDKSEFAIANAFTPNNDGVNDLLQLKVLGIIDVEYFKIYNRNGEEVFSTKTIGDGWDGKLKGVPQPNAAFVWMARGKDMNGKTITAKGSFVLIR